MTLALLRLAGCFADLSLLLFHIACRVVPAQLPRRPFPPRVGRDCSSAFFLHRLFTARLLPSSLSLTVSGLDTNIALISCPCFHRVRVLVFSLRFSSPSSSRFASLCLFQLPSPFCPSLLFPRSYTLRPVVAFFWSLFPVSSWSFCRRGGKSGAGSRMGENGDEDERMRGGGALSLERSRRYVR